MIAESSASGAVAGRGGPCRRRLPRGERPRPDDAAGEQQPVLDLGHLQVRGRGDVAPSELPRRAPATAASESTSARTPARTRRRERRCERLPLTGSPVTASRSAAPGMIGAASWPSHCSSSDAVERPEVGGRAQVAERVEAAGEARPLADHRARRRGVPITNAAAGGAVVGAGGGVLLRAATELRPDERDHAVVEPACLEVALEGERVCATSSSPASNGSAWFSWVSKTEWVETLTHSAAARRRAAGRPRPSAPGTSRVAVG